MKLTDALLAMVFLSIVINTFVSALILMKLEIFVELFLDTFVRNKK